MSILSASWVIRSCSKIPHLQQFVTQWLQSGKYQSDDEMVQAGLRLLQEREAELDRTAEKLRPAAERF